MHKKHKACLLAVLLWASLPLLAAPAAPTPAPKKTPAAASPARPPLNFSGVWEFDRKMSRGVSRNMEEAVLTVTQTGNRIFITPQGKAKETILAEEIVVDGQPYEKALGPAGKGLVTAAWGKDNRSLWIDVAAGTPEEPRAAVQQIKWTLSSDGNVWIRETVSISKFRTGRSRLVFRKKNT